MEEVRLFAGAIRVHLYAFCRNTEELQAGMAKLTPDVFEKVGSAELQPEVARLLHNWLASAASLIDTYRYFLGEIKPSEEFLTAYQAQVKKFCGEEMHVFVKELRNYTLHRRLPHLAGYHQKSSTNNVITSEVCGFSFLVSTLQEWNGWTKKSRTFLAAQDPFLEFSPVIAQYAESVSKLHEWFQAEIDTVMVRCTPTT